MKDTGFSDDRHEQVEAVKSHIQLAGLKLNRVAAILHRANVDSLIVDEIKEQLSYAQRKLTHLDAELHVIRIIEINEAKRVTTMRAQHDIIDIFQSNTTDLDHTAVALFKRAINLLARTSKAYAEQVVIARNRLTMLRKENS